MFGFCRARRCQVFSAHFLWHHFAYRVSGTNGLVATRRWFLFVGEIVDRSIRPKFGDRESEFFGFFGFRCLTFNVDESRVLQTSEQTICRTRPWAVFHEYRVGKKGRFSCVVFWWFLIFRLCFRIAFGNVIESICAYLDSIGLGFFLFYESAVFDVVVT